MRLLTPKFVKTLENLNANYWLIPVLLLSATIGLVYVLRSLDAIDGISELPVLSWAYSIGPDNARAMLSTLSGAIITVTGIAFSMIIVTLTLASKQFGARLIRNFMQDKKTQWSLGVFVSGFAYCYLLLGFIREANMQQHVPGVGLFVSLILSVGILITLIFLIHHLANSIQAESVIDNCWRQLNNDIDRIFPSKIEDQRAEFSLSAYEKLSECIKSNGDGYVQGIDYQSLVSLAEEHDIVIKIDIKAGKYVSKGQQVGEIYRPVSDEKDDTKVKDLCEVLVKHVLLGKSRTSVQDPIFAINQMVEIALRALSPSLNDPFTAITCLNRLSSSVLSIANKDLPQAVLLGEQGKMRVIRETNDFERIVKSSFDQIRHHCSDHISVATAFLEAIEGLVYTINNDKYKLVLKAQVRALKAVFPLNELSELDKNSLEIRFDRILNEESL